MTTKNDTSEVTAVDSLARVLTLRRAQILWWALGSLPCLAFAAALLTPRERARSALPPQLPAGAGG